MDTSRNRTLTAGAVVVTLVAGLLSLLAIQPASANHADGYVLELTPELGTVRIGADPALAGVTARLFDNVAGDPKTPDTKFVIEFEVSGGPASPTVGARCEIATTATTCEAPIFASTAGTSLIRGWISDPGGTSPNHDKDVSEGRLSAPVVDCRTEGAGEARQACEVGVPEPGDNPEPDRTDVVSVQFIMDPVEIDCEPEDGKTPRTEDAAIECVVLDRNGAPLAGQLLDAENLGGANDPDAGNNGTTADYDDSCVTGDNGRCTLTIPSAPGDQKGLANFCVWVDTDGDDAYSNEVADGGACNEAPADVTANANTTDVVAVEWQDRALTSLDVAPDVPASSTVGGSHTLTATAFDQFGAKWTASNTRVIGEFFSGSPSDTDANTPATPDLGSCDTNAGEGDDDPASCTFTYTSRSAGTDLICFWFGATPAAMTGTHIGNASCAGEGVITNENPRVDVVAKRWTVAADTSPPETTSDQGYTLVGADGGIFTYGTSKFHGSTGDLDLNEPVIGMANKKGGTGYWLVAKDGGIFSFGDAEFFGSMGDKKLNAPILGMEATPSGRGYYLFAADGGIFTFGDAVFHGSTGDRKLNAPAVGLAVNQRGDGYWLVAQDGGIFSFGRVPFHGSTGDRKLNEPVFDMAPTAGDNGYWLVAKDGGVFSFGDAEGKFYGSAVGATTAPVIGMGATPSFDGYWIADAQGAVFHFGDALFLGDRRNTSDNAATVGFATVPRK